MKTPKVPYSDVKIFIAMRLVFYSECTKYKGNGMEKTVLSVQKAFLFTDFDF